MNQDDIYENSKNLEKVWPIWPTNAPMLADASTLLHRAKSLFAQPYSPPSHAKSLFGQPPPPPPPPPPPALKYFFTPLLS